MTYLELRTIILKQAHGLYPGVDHQLDDDMLKDLVENARAFTLLKMTNSGREVEGSLVQHIENLRLNPLPVKQTELPSLAQNLPSGADLNTINPKAYYKSMYYAELPSEFLHFSNNRAVHSITSVDRKIQVVVVEADSIRNIGDELFPTAFIVAWMRGRFLYLKDVSEDNTWLTIREESTDTLVQDRSTWPAGDLLFFEKTVEEVTTTNPLPVKMVNVSGVFRDPIAVAKFSSNGEKAFELNDQEINIPAEYTDFVIQQVFSNYVAKALKTKSDLLVDGKPDTTPDKPAE